MSEITDLLEEQREGNKELTRVSNHARLLQDMKEDLELLYMMNEDTRDSITNAVPRIVRSVGKVRKAVEDFEIPEMSIPEIAAPKIDIPEIKIPEVVVPKTEVSVPEIKVPKIDIPAPIVEEANVGQQIGEFFSSLEERNKELQKILEENKAIDIRNNEATEAAQNKSLSLLDKIFGKEQPQPVLEPKVEVPDVLTPDEYYKTLTDDSEQELFYLASIDNTLKEQLKELTKKELERGTIAGFGDKDKKDDDAGDGEGIFETISGITDMGRFFGKGKFGKLLGKGMKFAKIGGAITGTAFLLKDLYEGFTDPKIIQNITGKTMDKLTDAEHSTASIAHAIESLSFGFIDAKAAFDLALPAVDTMQKGIDHIFDPDKGVFGDFTKGLFQIVDGDFSVGMSSILDGIVSWPTKLLEKVDLVTKSLFDIDFDISGKIMGGLNAVFDHLFDPAEGVFGKATSALFSFIDGEVLEGFKNLGELILDIPKKIFGKVSDLIGWITGGDFNMKEMASKGLEAATSAVSETVSGAVGGIKDFFGFGSDEPEVKEQPKVKARTVEAAVPKTREGANIPTTVSPPNTVNTIEKTKEREKQVVEKQSMMPPVVIQQPPAKEEKKILRRTADPDMMLGLMNANMMEG